MRPSGDLLLSTPRLLLMSCLVLRGLFLLCFGTRRVTVLSVCVCGKVVVVPLKGGYT